MEGHRSIHQRQIQSHALADPNRRPPPNRIRFLHFRERHRPPLWRRREIPRLNWVFRGFYGYFYQAPPLVTATGALLDLANSQNFTFSPLKGERDIEWQFGVTIPFHGWNLERR